NPPPPHYCAVLSLKIWASKSSCNRKPHFVSAPLLVGIELNPGPEQLSEKERWWIVFLSQENDRSPSQIARVEESYMEAAVIVGAECGSPNNHHLISPVVDISRV